MCFNNLICVSDSNKSTHFGLYLFPNYCCGVVLTTIRDWKENLYLPRGSSKILTSTLEEATRRNFGGMTNQHHHPDRDSERSEHREKYPPPPPPPPIPHVGPVIQQQPTHDARPTEGYQGYFKQGHHQAPPLPPPPYRPHDTCLGFCTGCLGVIFFFCCCR